MRGKAHHTERNGRFIKYNHVIDMTQNRDGADSERHGYK